MINEDDRDLAPAQDLVASSGSAAPEPLREKLGAAVSEVLRIEQEEWTPTTPITASFHGTLLLDAEPAFDKLEAAFSPLNHTAILTESGGRQTVRAIKGRVTVRPREWWPNLLLFILTVFSLLFVGSLQDPAPFVSFFDLLRGLPYALGVLLILGSHELGHYFAARGHGVAVTLPYFIPMPVPGTFGTLGAFIQLREPMRNRKVLLDIGAAGPLIGLCFAIPILLIGLATSPVKPTVASQVFMLRSYGGEYIQEGNSILYIVAKILVFGRNLPDGMSDVIINQLTMAGWTGLLVTGLNLIPIGQLDGGHALFSLIGERARVLFFPFMAIVAVLSYFYTGWVIWLVLLFVLGRVYATPLNMVTKLDRRRRILAVLCLVAFVLVFMPFPESIYSVRLWTS